MIYDVVAISSAKSNCPLASNLMHRSLQSLTYSHTISSPSIV